MNIITVYSIETDPRKAASHLQSQMEEFNPSVVIYFASSHYNPDIISRSMQQAFPQADTFGCSTAGEIFSGQLLKNSIVAMGMNADVIDDINLQVVTDIQTMNHVDEAFKRFKKYFSVDPHTMNLNEYVGIILADGLSKSEENLMDHIGELSNILFIGGSSGDDLKFSRTWVYANGKSYTDAAVLALLRPKVGFSFIKTQSFKPCSSTLVATKVNPEERKVIEFNNKPARMAYAEAIGVSVDQIENYFMSNPVGLVIDDEPYVRSPQRIEGDEMYFYCNVMEGMALNLLEASDIIKDTRDAIESKKKELSGISGIINFNCILRTLELEKTGLADAYADIFADIPTIGFSTYGEAFLGHINQTATMLVLS
jgi:hypothetical protein